MDAVEPRLRKLRIADMIIGVVATNLAAIEFYERRGAAPFDSRLIQRRTALMTARAPIGG